MTSSAVPKTRAVTLHVDVGPSLKQAVVAAAASSGVRPSDWVRAALQRAVAVTSPVDLDPARSQPAGSAPQGGPPWRALRPASATLSPRAATSVGAPAAGMDSARSVTDIRLAPDDVLLLDEIVQRAGFRSRAAALRYLLRVLRREGGPEAVDALAQLPATIPALTDSNIMLQRLLSLLPQSEAGQGAPAREVLPVLDPLAVRAHLEAVSRVLAALRPLLLIRAPT